MKSTKQSNFGPLPLVIGITGHRDLRDEDLAGLKARVHEIFVNLSRRYPHTPLMLLSPLAEGADRLVARVALAQGVRLVVPLPFKKELYEEDFDSGGSLEEFRELLQQANHWFELPVLEGLSETSIQEQSEARSHQYAYVGAYIVRHCQILLALWDGVRSPMALGGTASIIQFKLDGIPERYAPRHSLLDPVESGPVYHLVTPRTSKPHPRQPALTLVKVFPAIYESDTVAEASYKRIYERMEQFNRDALRMELRLAEERAASRASLIPAAEGDRLSAGLEALRDRYATADVLASHFQRLTSRVLVALFTLTFLGALFLAVSAQSSDFGWANIFYGATVVLAAATYFWAKRGNFESKYQDYRALAEGLRVQFFWLLAGMRDKVPEHYLRLQRNELDWIRDALRIWAMPVTPEHADAARGSKSAAMLQDILVHWVKNQQAYFSSAARRNRQKLHRLQRWALGFFVIGVLWTASGFLLARIYPQGSVLEHLPGGTVLAIALGLTPGVTALLYSYIRMSALPEHTKQYGQMSSVFATAQERLAASLAENNMARAEAIVRELGQGALIENVAWLMLHRERLLERPLQGQRR